MTPPRAASIKLDKPSKTFREGDTISGALEINAASEITHEGVTITLEGSVTLQSTKGSEKEKISLADATIQIVKPGRIPQGKLSIPFSLVLEKKSQDLLDTYHGVNINIEYILKGEVKRTRSFLSGALVTPPTEIYVEAEAATPTSARPRTEPKQFVMTPSTVERKRINNAQQPLKDFRIRGRLEATTLQIDEPLQGLIAVEACEKAVKSIEVQLIRVEQVGGQDRQTSEVQNIQVAEGDVLHNLEIPLYLVFPRYFSCPGFNTNAFSLSFEVNINVIFSDNHVVANNFPIVLYR